MNDHNCCKNPHCDFKSESSPSGARNKSVWHESTPTLHFHSERVGRNNAKVKSCFSYVVDELITFDWLKVLLPALWEPLHNAAARVLLIPVCVPRCEKLHQLVYREGNMGVSERV